MTIQRKRHWGRKNRRTSKSHHKRYRGKFYREYTEGQHYGRPKNKGGQ